MPLRSAGGAPRSSRGVGRLRQAPARRERSALAVAGAVFALVALVGVGIGAYVLSRASHVAIDPETLCPVEQPPAEVVAVLLDMSDRLNEVQLLAVRNHLNRILYGELPRFARVEVYAVQDRPSAVAEPVVGLCNPGKGDDLSRIYQNPDLARRRWERDFAESIGAKLDALLAAPDSASSPIFEAIQAVAVRLFGKPEYDGVPKRLIVVSDLLQNVRGRGSHGSHYRGVPAFEEFRSSPYFAQVRADLDGVRVHLYYMNRSDQSVQGARHIRFWDEYFSAQGATVMTVERIFGD
ncbi:MAG TPA: hypothetical protein VF322_00440 [Gammaproteobacteria bacterium]